MADSHGGVKALLVNLHERTTDGLLTEAAAEHGDRLLTKVRLADVIDVDHLSGRRKSFALAAHLDFVMVSEESAIPRFAVELDGMQHWTDPVTMERDKLKDALCKAAQLPLLRITSDFTRKQGRWRALSYIVDAFYFSEAFYDAQESGIIPLDEPFDVASVIVNIDDAGLMGFNSLDSAVRLRLLNYWKSKKLPHFAPDEYITKTADGRVQAHAFLVVGPDRYLMGRVRVRDFLFQGISPGEIASQLVTAEVGDLADRWLAGEAVASNSRTVLKAMAEVQEAIDADRFISSFTGGSDLPGSIRLQFGDAPTAT